jgi:hypothetical protein
MALLTPQRTSRRFRFVSKSRIWRHKRLTYWAYATERATIRIAEGREKRLGAVFAVASFMTAIWSAVIYQTVYHALINSFPPPNFKTL